jgi:hypothetical protein
MLDSLSGEFGATAGSVTRDHCCSGHISFHTYCTASTTLSKRGVSCLKLLFSELALAEGEEENSFHASIFCMQSSTGVIERFSRTLGTNVLMKSSNETSVLYRTSSVTALHCSSRVPFLNDGVCASHRVTGTVWGPGGSICRDGISREALCWS